MYLYIVHSAYFAFPFFKDFSWFLISVRIKAYRHLSPPPCTQFFFLEVEARQTHTHTNTHTHTHPGTHRPGWLTLCGRGVAARLKPETRVATFIQRLRDSEADVAATEKEKKCKGLTLVCGSAFLFATKKKKRISKPNVYRSIEEKLS